jgi:hypothetical protein
MGSLYYGARRQYTEAYRYWHELEGAKAAPDWVIRPEFRRFPIPAICKPGPVKKLFYDVVFVSDFSLGALSRNASMLRMAHALGLRCACFHWPRLESAGLDVDPKIRKLLHEGIADNVVAGENLVCGLVVVCDGRILDHLPDLLPEIQTKRCYIVDERGSSDVEARVINAVSAFGAGPQWLPGAQVEHLLCVLRAEVSAQFPTMHRA